MSFNLAINVSDNARSSLNNTTFQCANLRQFFYMKYYGLAATLEGRNQNGSHNKYYRLCIDTQRNCHAEWGRIGNSPRTTNFYSFLEADNTFRKKLNNKGYSIFNPTVGEFPFRIVEIREETKVGGGSFRNPFFECIALDPNGDKKVVWECSTLKEALNFWLASTK